MPKYKCVGCNQIHNDNDYSESDGDILIYKEYLQEIKHRIDYFFLQTDGSHKYPTPQVSQICQMIIELNNAQTKQAEVKDE